MSNPEWLSRSPNAVRAWAMATVAALLVACAPGDPAGPDPEPAVYGSLTISVSGLPATTPAVVTVAGPGGYSRSISGTTTLTDLAAGNYLISAGDVIHEGSRFAPSPSTQSVAVGAGAPASATGITYALASGSLAISVTGLPTATAALIVVSGPAGYGRTITEPFTISGLTPGTYVVEARPVQTSGSTWTAQVAVLTIEVSASPTPAPAAFTYNLATGSLTVTVGGLPDGVPAAVRVTGPAGYATTLATTTTLTNLQPGLYTVVGDPVIAGVDTYRAPPSQGTTVIAVPAPAQASVPYALATGRLTINVGGHPDGSSPVIQVTGPGGYTATPAVGATLTGLVPGVYTISATPLSTGTATFAPTPASQQVNVPASTSPTQAAINYALATGSLNVTVTGVPQGSGASVTVSGPNGFAAQLTASATLNNLAPGSYTIAAANVTSGVHVYAPSPSVQNATVPASAVPATASVAYALNSGLLALTVTGLPQGVAAAITIDGPGGFSLQVTGSTTVSGLLPGTYQVNAGVVSNGGSFTPAPPNQPVVVTASTVPVPVSVTYTAGASSLQLTVTGLPGGLPAAISITGPGGFSASPTTSQTYSNVAPGTYTITALNVTQPCVTYAPGPPTQQVIVSAGQSQAAMVTYTAPGGGGLNLCIDGAYITQSVQTYAGGVPLVSGRNALLRVFVRANQANAAQPSVRVRLYNGAVLANTITIPAPGASVPTIVDEATLASSWNTTLTGAQLVPGLRMLIDVDPTGVVPESNEADNALPASGTPAALDVRTVGTLNVTLVPVTQSATGLTANVNDGNKASYIAPMQKMFPLAAVDAEVRSQPYTFPGLELQSGGTNWSQLLGDINALRVTEGNGRHYYGVVKVSYSSGVAGLGYISVPAAIGWDHLPSGTEVMAHEFGHNFGRLHAPCGGPTGVDPSYPYPNAQIGQFGYDIVLGVLKSPTLPDLMSYCSNEWISDYNYNAILNYRAANPMVTSARIVAPAQSAARNLLVWGRIEGGRLVLEPAFEVDAPPSLPVRGGPNRLEGFGPGGDPLFALDFAGDRIADAPDPNEQTFAFVIPAGRLGTLERIRFTALGRQAELRAAGAGTTAATARAQRTAQGKVRVDWTGGGMRAALVRNARTGQILTIARGAVDLPAVTDDLDITLSDGVKSVKSKVRPF